MKFIKMHGNGNDFVIIDLRQQASIIITDALIKRICDRHYGVGCDQLILLNSSDIADVKIIIYNQDASLAESCGNGIRCVAYLEYREKDNNNINIESHGGKINFCTILNDKNILVNMGFPIIDWQKIPLSSDMNNFDLPVIDCRKINLSCEVIAPFSAISFPNPHLILFIEDFNPINIDIVGPILEKHEFFPNRTNVNFVKIISPLEIELRTWERGVGETLCCGSGACASVVAACYHELCNNNEWINVTLKGGNLAIKYNKQEGTYMKGPAEFIFTGYFNVSI